MELQTTQLAPAHDLRWKAMIQSSEFTNYKCLALKIILTRLHLESLRGDKAIDQLVGELRSFFEANIQMAEADYVNIFGGAK